MKGAPKKTKSELRQYSGSDAGILARSIKGFGLAVPVKVEELLDAKVALQTFTGIAAELEIKKVTLDVLALAFGIPQTSIQNGKVSISPEQETIADIIARSLENEKDSEVRADLWHRCDALLKYQMLLPEIDHMNLDLYSLLELDGNTVRKAFTRKLSLVRPVQGKSAVHYGDIDEVAAGQLANILSKLPLQDARELLLGINPKVLYLLTTSEIKAFITDGGTDSIMDIRCALDYFDSIPADCVLLNWIQDFAYDIYESIRYDITNNEYPELRSIFYDELDMRDLLLKVKDTELWRRYSPSREMPESNIEDIIDSIDSPEIKGDD
jgi:hypothetical protein